MTRPTPSSQPRSHGLVPRFRYTDQHIRVSDAERTEVADRLAANFGEGRLTQAEFDERVARAMSAKTRGDLRGLFDDLPEPGPAADPAVPGRRPLGPVRPMRSYAQFVVLALVVVVVTAGGTAGEAVLGHVAGLKTWLMVGIITAIVVYAAGMLSRSRRSSDR
jgi:hypothetical protein